MVRLVSLRSLPWIVLVIAVAVGPDAATAQAQSLFGNRGPANQIGTNLRGSPVGQSTTFGMSSGGATGLPQSGQPTPGFAGTASTLTSQAGGQSRTPSNGFVGRGDTASRFVGTQQAGQQQFGQQQFGRQALPTAPTRQFGTPGTGGRPGQATGAPFGANGQQPGARSTRTQPILRPRQEVAFSYPERSPTTINTALTGRFEKLSQRTPGLRGVAVAVNEQGTAILRGEVDSAETSRLAAMMARLEPGIRTIQNELTVREK